MVDTMSRGFLARSRNLLFILSIVLNVYLVRLVFHPTSSKSTQLENPSQPQSYKYTQLENPSIVQNTEFQILDSKPLAKERIKPSQKTAQKKETKSEKPQQKDSSESTTANVYCDVRSPWAEKAVKYPTTTDLTDWRFVKRRKCPSYSFDTVPEDREQVVLSCQKNSSYMHVTRRKSTDQIEQVQFGSQCLIDVVDACCNDNKNVPNVAHFIWYGAQELGYFQFLTFMSLLRFMQPCLILIHGNAIPHGKYWDYFKSLTPNIIHVNRTRPVKIFGHSLAHREHASDLMRIEALQLLGGVYVDFDEVILRSLEPLRVYEYTQGHELPHTLGSQLVMAKKNATFLTHWYLSYRDKYKYDWAYNALWVPWEIAVKFPHLIHVEGYNFTRPSWRHVNRIFYKSYDWSTNYGMHLFIRWYNRTTDVNVIRTLRTTIGSVSRHVLFGNKELCTE